MNCLAHCYRYLDDDPWFVAGAVLPDWLSLVARRTRVRTGDVADWKEHSKTEVRQLARGITRHHHDDSWFHSCRAFVELNMQFAGELGMLTVADKGLRPRLVGHIVIEMLLDSWLAKADMTRLTRFYSVISAIDPGLLESTVNRMAGQPTDRLAGFVPRFIEERYLYDYLDDALVGYRMNRVLRRAGLAAMPNAFVDWVATARPRVNRRAGELLNEPKTT